MIVCWQTACPSGDVCLLNVLITSNLRLRQREHGVFTKRLLSQKNKTGEKKSNVLLTRFYYPVPSPASFKESCSGYLNERKNTLGVLFNRSKAFLFMYLTLGQTLSFFAMNRLNGSRFRFVPFLFCDCFVGNERRSCS